MLKHENNNKSKYLNTSNQPKPIITNYFMFKVVYQNFATWGQSILNTDTTFDPLKSIINTQKYRYEKKIDVIT